MVSNEVPTFKVVLVGDGGVGKTTFMKWHTTGKFETKYIPTLGVEVHPLEFMTKKYGGLQNGYYINGQACIIMYDATSRITYKNVPDWHRDVMNVLCTPPGGTLEDNWVRAVPTALCGMKTDLPARIQPSKITFHKKKKLPFYEISTKTGHNLDAPFLFLAQQLLGRADLVFVDRVQPGQSEVLVGKAEQELNSLPTQASKDVRGEQAPSYEASDDQDSDNGSGRDDTPNTSQTDAADEKSESVTETKEVQSDPPGGVATAIRDATQNLDSLSVTDSRPETLHLFVLCACCARMVYIESDSGTLKKVCRANDPFTLVTTYCRSCSSYTSRDGQSPTLSRKIVTQSRLYDCALLMSGGHLGLGKVEKRFVVDVSHYKITDCLSKDCRIYGIDTSPETLKNLASVPKETLFLPYVPGAFF